MSETKHTEAVLTVFTRLGRSLSLQCITLDKLIISNIQQYFHASQLPSALHYYLSACRCCGSTRGPCRFGNYLVASGCTYGLNTVSFHSVSLSVSFDAVSDRLGPCKCSSRPRLPMLQQFLPTCRDLPLHVPWRLW